jgi:hypothetical protein
MRRMVLHLLPEEIGERPVCPQVFHYGRNGWKLRAGDELEVAIWNPQSGMGPALYRVRVMASQ